MQEIESKYVDKGVKVLGLITADDKADAIKVLEMKGAKYKNIEASESMGEFLSQFAYIPATMFINRKGEVVGEYIVGEKSYDEFAKIIDQLLKEQ